MICPAEQHGSVPPRSGPLTHPIHHKRKAVHDKMNYVTLAEEFLGYIRKNSKLKYQRAAEDFTHGEMSILCYLHFAENGACPVALCSALGMTTPRMSAALRSLTDKGLVKRKTDDSDKRRVHIYITENGDALVEERYGELKKNIAGMLEALGEADAREYVRISGKLSRLEL